MVTVTMITFDPIDRSGHRARVGRTLNSVVGVLRRLERGATEEELVAESARYVEPPVEPLTPEGIRSAARHAAEACGEWSMSLQAKEAFFVRHRPDSLSAQLRAMREQLGVGQAPLRLPGARELTRQARDWAIPVLGCVGRGLALTDAADALGVSLEVTRWAVSWGAAVVYDRDAAAVALDAEPDAVLRQVLGSWDRALLDDDYRYCNALAESTVTRTPDVELARWERFVATVETGYEDILDEYVLSLSHRDQLATSIDLITPAGRRAADQLIGLQDERFLAATEDLGYAMFGMARWSPRHWWYYRVPRRLGPRMERDLNDHARFASPW